MWMMLVSFCVPKAIFASSLEKHPHNPLLSFVFLTYFYSFLVWVHSDGVHASEYKEARGDNPRADVKAVAGRGLGTSLGVYYKSGGHS